MYNNVNSNTVAAVHRPVAKEGAEQLDEPQHYKVHFFCQMFAR